MRRIHAVGCCPDALQQLHCSALRGACAKRSDRRQLSPTLPRHGLTARQSPLPPSASVCDAMLLHAPPCRGAAPRRGAAAPRELRRRAGAPLPQPLRRATPRLAVHSPRSAAPGRCCAAARGDNDRQARAEEAAQQRTARALDASLAAITRLVGVGDMFGGVGSSRPALPPGQEAAPPADADVKRVSFRARAKSKRQVAQARCAYLLRPVALPDAPVLAGR